ncbi:choice-of-anchor L domain-containing protein [Sulfurimonas sp.]|uniref:choice-of-anchor L domain-containing protein n=1 Tax=Sulfurimonas sp. TaxID=2022749 RepID=UPI00260BF915|nr:choice-of-anchor L domain-containing protein [Sulfurimonas sp.]
MKGKLLKLISFFTFFIFTPVLFAATNCVNTSTANCKYDVTATELASQIQGIGITITNPKITFGEATQVGTFSNGVGGAKLEIDEGIILTAMSVQESFTTNSNWRTSITHTANLNDPDLLAIDPRANFDTVVFEFDVTLDENTRLLLVDYQFASEEYNEYVGSRFNDSFGFFVSGGDLNQTYNIARVIDNQHYVNIDNINNYDTVTVNNVNNGLVGVYDDGTPEILTNTQYYIDNCVKGKGVPNCTQTKAPINVEYDGLTHKLHATLDKLTPGETYHFKMALADTSDDQWDTGVFVNKINGLREPSICYDYAYKQNELYLTEGYDPAKGPYISGDAVINNTNEPIEVAMYFRNMKDSEIVATDIFFNLIDINTSQASYKANSTWVTEPNSFTRTKISDGVLDTSSSYVKGIPITSFDAYDYFYIYVSLDPYQTPLSLPINARIDYNLTIPLSADPNDVLIISRSSVIDQDVPICSNGSHNYAPVYGNFNIIENGLYTDETNYYYNINTQVTNRKGNLSVISVDTNESLNPSLHVLKATSTVVAVDMLDLKSFHFTEASCSEITNSISDREWVVFENVSKVPLNPDNVTFNQIAREDAAFRISYNVDPDTGEIITLETLNNNGEKRYNVLNFPDAIKEGVCAVGTNKVEDYCSDSGTSFDSAMTKNELDLCMECVYGLSTKLVCSRDNFSIRPEAFLANIDDQNQTNPNTPKVRLTTNYSGATTLVPQTLHLAAGYQYNLEINATNHIDNNASRGYNTVLNAVTGTTSSYQWSPTTTKTGCNDTTNKDLNITIINGIREMNSSISQVGEYTLALLDTTWTSIDRVVQAHHTGSYFTTTPDCVVGSSAVPKSITFDHFTGCNISSVHTNLDNGLQYVNLRPTFHPYEFDLRSIVPSVGLNDDPDIVNSPFIYMADLSKDENMSYHLNGNIKAVGKNAIVTTNFVEGCYATPLDINISRDIIDLPVAYQYRVHIQDENATDIRDVLKDINNSKEVIALASSDFIKSAKGEVKTILNLNYQRKVNKAINPQAVTFIDYDVKCSNSANCGYAADFNVANETKGNIQLNHNIKHYYARSHVQRQRYFGNEGNASITYEVFCDISNDGNKTLLQDDINSTFTDDPRWFVNTKHTNNYGKSGQIKQKGANYVKIVAGTEPTGNYPDIITLKYDGTNGYPYKATMQDKASNWLIYGKYNPNAVVNEFEVEFINNSGNWAGQAETDTTTKKNAADQTNRRLMW